MFLARISIARGLIVPIVQDVRVLAITVSRNNVQIRLRIDSRGKLSQERLRRLMSRATINRVGGINHDRNIDLNKILSNMRL